MRLIVADVRPSVVAARWAKQYGPTFSALSSSRVIYERLTALPASAAPAEIDAIIGNNCWTGTMCSECTEYARVVVEFGVAGNETVLCPSCATRAVAILGAAPSVGTEMVTVLWFRYADGSGACIARAYESAARGGLDCELLSAHANAGRWSLVDVPFLRGAQ